MESVAVRVVEVSKRFRIAKEPCRSLKETTIRFVKRRLQFESFLALDRVSIEARQGETLAIIGANGSGKSTLFKIISGILRPTLGHVEVRGRLSPLIELSAGFHPELSGVENVYLNGAIYGMRRHEVAAKLPLITAFAEIGDFMHSPVRTYSSGMMARLAFAVAINVDADVLLVDEVLSVGDAQFQERCMRKLAEVKAAGTTIVYISHDMASVARVADRALLLDHGAVRAEGAPAEVIATYLERMRASAPVTAPA